MYTKIKFDLKDKVYQGLGNVLYLEHDSLTDLLLAVSLMTAEMRPVGESVTELTSGERAETKVKTTSDL